MDLLTPAAERVAEAAAAVRFFRRRVDLARDPLIRAYYVEALENARERLEKAQAAETAAGVS